MEMLNFAGSSSSSGSGYGDGDGYGSGDGDGYGSSDGNGDGYGNGSSSGDGYGNGSSSGDGYGDDSGIKTFCGKPVTNIDGLETIIDRVHGMTARGRILQQDLTTRACRIVKSGNTFAHGNTLKDAMDALEEKLFDGMPREERIDAFMACHNYDTKYSAKDFFEWHHKLTGSCLAGRSAFAQDHEIDMDAKMTTGEFISLTKNAYGGDTIRALEKQYRARKSGLCGDFETDGREQRE